MLKLPSKKEAIILELLSPGRELYGLEMANSNNLKRKSIALSLVCRYINLNRMEDKGYLTSREEACRPGLPRRLYKITDLGQKVLAAWRTAQREINT